MVYRWFDKRKQWIIWVVYAGLAILLVAIGYLFYQNEYKSLLTQKYNEINSIADLKESLILAWRNERISDARVFATDDNFLAQILQFKNNPDDLKIKQAIQDRISIIKNLYSYEDILIANENGSVTSRSTKTRS